MKKETSNKGNEKEYEVYTYTKIIEDLLFDSFKHKPTKEEKERFYKALVKAVYSVKLLTN